ncbi:hypothetical protein M404DRAFT_1001441 [Pisolithus tinctorius Marx 270]|uniref:Uncharacterized protein n=1 Tax=Pisolithus tinctorius Marx 270 TaxID=870435 RepID=A0A0C3P7T3_PISTI|nr:hypothetical protein M404DRAFT_1001441 [Pisolithus tinctorius Marx 270]
MALRYTKPTLTTTINEAVANTVWGDIKELWTATLGGQADETGRGLISHYDAVFEHLPVTGFALFCGAC